MMPTNLLKTIAGLRNPPLRPWEHHRPLAAPAVLGKLRARFLGVSTILLSDGKNAILTDGFFTRPGPLRARFGRLRPDEQRIDDALDRFDIDRLDAVFVLHSHFDHALDSPIVAARTGAQLYGSPSTHNIARGYGFPSTQFVTLPIGHPIDIGDFRITAIPSLHSPGDLAPGFIDQPLDVASAKALSYKTGDCYTLHVDHPSGQLLIQASANFIPGALAGHHADTVFLGIGMLGKQPDSFKAEYWDAVIAASGACRVIPIHWDNFTLPLHKPLQPLPKFFDDVSASMRFLSQRGQSADVKIMLPILGRLVDPFAEPE